MVELNNWGKYIEVIMKIYIEILKALDKFIIIYNYNKIMEACKSA